MVRAVGSPGSVFETWGRARAGLVRRARRRVGSAPDAEDVVQDAALAAFALAHTLRDATRSAAWVARMVDHKATDLSRAHTRYRHIRGDLREAQHVPTEDPVAHCFCVRAQARKLRPIYAEVLERIDERGESIPAVANTLGLTPNATTVRLSRARAELREAVKRHCGTTGPQSCEDCGCRERRCCAPVEDAVAHDAE